MQTPHRKAPWFKPRRRNPPSNPQQDSDSHRHGGQRTGEHNSVTSPFTRPVHSTSVVPLFHTAALWERHRRQSCVTFCSAALPHLEVEAEVRLDKMSAVWTGITEWCKGVEGMAANSTWREDTGTPDGIDQGKGKEKCTGLNTDFSQLLLWKQHVCVPWEQPGTKLMLFHSRSFLIMFK